MDKSLWEVMQSGGVAMWVIGACSILAVAVAFERLHSLWGFLDKARSLADTVNRCVTRGAFAEARAACERSRSPVADVFLVGFERHGRVPEAQVEAAVERARVRMNLDFRRRLWVLGTVGAMAPFVGLYGTVVGIMGAFQSLKGAKGENQLDIVGPSISEALVATAAGILVAVVSVAIYNWLSAHMQRVALEVKLVTEEFVENLKDAGRSGSAPAAADKAGGGDKSAASDKGSEKKEAADGDRKASRE